MIARVVENEENLEWDGDQGVWILVVLFNERWKAVGHAY